MHESLSFVDCWVDARAPWFPIENADGFSDELAIGWREHERMVLKGSTRGCWHRVDGVGLLVDDQHVPRAREFHLAVGDTERDGWADSFLEVRDLVEHEVQHLGIEDPVVTKHDRRRQAVDDVRLIDFVQDVNRDLQCARSAK